jgi:flagellar hook protein FlgE
VVASGSLTFDSNGNLSSPTGSITGINIAGLADGAAAMNLTWNLAGAGGSSLLTQVNSPSATTATHQDGYSSGVLQSYTVQGDGTIEGQFSNGQVQALGQIALANFANTQGLQLVGGDAYAPTLASGSAVVGVPNSGTLGTLTGGALESSNVNISKEFTNLIVAERAFQADARMITTLDAVSNVTINLQAAPGN